MVFWAARTLDPKRKFRWLVNFSELGVSEYVAKSVTKPEWTIASTPHKFINHTFNFPGRVTWNTIDVKFADPGGTDDDVATVLYNLLAQNGYAEPANADRAKQSVTKGRSTAALGRVTIQQLGGRNEDVLEEWHLRNAWASKVTFGALSYDDEGLMELGMTLVYDWAHYEPPREGADTGGGFRPPTDRPTFTPEDILPIT